MRDLVSINSLSLMVNNFQRQWQRRLQASNSDQQTPQTHVYTFLLITFSLFFPTFYPPQPIPRCHDYLSIQHSHFLLPYRLLNNLKSHATHPARFFLLMWPRFMRLHIPFIGLHSSRVLLIMRHGYVMCVACVSHTSLQQRVGTLIFFGLTTPYAILSPHILTQHGTLVYHPTILLSPSTYLAMCIASISAFPLTFPPTPSSLSTLLSYPRLITQPDRFFN